MHVKPVIRDFLKMNSILFVFLEAVLAGSVEPEKINNSSVARAMERAPALRARIEATKYEVDGQVVFNPEEQRIKNVMLKLARGHAAFEKAA